MELSDYLRVLRKRWRLVLLVPLLSVGAAALITSRTTPQYQSTVQFFVSTPATSADAGTAYTGGLFSQQRVKSYADLLSGPRLADAVQRELGGPQSAEPIDISARVQPDTVLLTATVTDPDPHRALAVARAVARVFPTLVDELEKPLDGGPATIKAVVSAEPALGRDPVSPRPVRNLALALVVGALLGAGAAVARETADNTVKTPEQLREIGDVATLGAIAYDPRASKRPLIVQDDPRAPRAEAFRHLRTNLQFVEIDRPLRSLVVTSPLPGEGKSTSACNLAITLAQSGIRVLLLEGDLRRPKVTDYLGLEGAVGLTSVLIGQASLDDAIQTWGQDDLAVLPSGPLPPNPSELLASTGMREVMEQLEQRYQVVIVDAPPLLPVTDAAILATITSGALFCIRSGRVRRDQVRRALEALEAVDAVVLGALFTMVPRRGPDSYGGYGYGYGYGSYTSDTTRAQMDIETARAAGRSPALATSRAARPTEHAVGTHSVDPAVADEPAAATERAGVPDSGEGAPAVAVDVVTLVSDEPQEPQEPQEPARASAHGVTVVPAAPPGTPSWEFAAGALAELRDADGVDGPSDADSDIDAELDRAVQLVGDLRGIVVDDRQHEVPVDYRVRGDDARA